jgi:hypothetical protein
MKWLRLISFFFFFLFPVFSYSTATNITVQTNHENYGVFKVNVLPGWKLDTENTNETYITFNHYINGNLNYMIRLKQQPTQCPTKKEFNRLMYQMFEEQLARKDFVDKFKPKSDYSLLGHKNCHMMTYVSQKYNHRGFILNAFVNNQAYTIYVFDKVAQKIKIRQEALNFIAGISINDNPEIFIVQNQSETKVEVEGKSGTGKVSENIYIETEKIDDTKLKYKVDLIDIENKRNINRNGNMNKGDIAIPRIDLSKMTNIPPSKPLPFLEINTISQTEWDGAVSAAMEGMRLIYGPLTNEENIKFEIEWAPLRQTPFEEAVSYLNKFNPLLGEFLSYRSSINQSSILMEQAMQSAGYAAEYDDRELSLSYLDLARKYQNLLISRQKRLQQITNDLVALGNPPNGAKIMNEKQRRYKEAFNLNLTEYQFEGEWLDADGKRFLLKVAYKYNDDKVLVYKFPISTLELMVAKGYDINKPGAQKVDDDDVFLGVIPSVFDLLMVFEELEPNVWLTRNYSGVEVVSIYQIHDNVMTANFYQLPSALSNRSKVTSSTNSKIKSKYITPPVPPFDDKAKTWKDLLEVVPQDNWAGSKHRRYMAWRQNAEEVINITLLGPSETTKRKEEYEGKKEALPKWRNDYSYQLQKLNEEYADVLNGNVQPNVSKTTSSIPIEEKEEMMDENLLPDENLLHFDDDKSPEDRRKIDTETIQFHNDNITIIQKNLISDQNELAKATEIKSIKNLEMRILSAQSNIQSEKDRIETIKTGIIVYNRTPWDNYAKSNFIQKIAKDQRKMENISRGMRKAYEMADRLPDDEARKVRKIINEKYTGKIMADMNEEAAGEIINEANAIGKKYFKSKMDKDLADNKEAFEEAEWAETCLYTAEIVKTTADYTMMGLSLFGGKHVNCVYQGITGYIDGGPKEAFLRVSGSYNQATGVAVDAFRGFEGAINEGGDLSDALLGATWEATKGIITEKTMEFGVGKISSKFNRPNGEIDLDVNSRPQTVIDADGTSQRPRGNTELSKTNIEVNNTPKIEEPDFNRPLTKQEIEVHRQQVSDGRNKVNSYKKTFEKLENARKAGAPPSEIKKILIELDDRSAKIHSSPQAKIMMKNLQKQPKNIEMIKRYSNSMDRVHKKVEKRYQAEMQKNGWTTEELEPIRNKPDPGELQRSREMEARGETVPPEALLGSKTVNMDYDAGRKPKFDDNGRPIPPMKNGKPVPIEAWQAEAQAAWEKSYQAETGQSPRHSWENITHAKMSDAYADLPVLEKNGILNANKDWAGQTSDVTYNKATHLRDAGDFERVEKYVEIARGTSKDYKTKMKPLFDQKKPKAGTPSFEAWQKQTNYWLEINNVLEEMGNGRLDPINADRKIRLKTGGKSVLEVTFDMRNYMESLMILGKNSN